MAALLEAAGVDCELRLPDGELVRVGAGTPAFTVVFKNERALDVPLTELGLGKAYVEGDLDLEGDMLAVFDVRDQLRRNAPLVQKLRFAYDLLRAPVSANREAVGFHYDFGDDFYLSFIDTRFRFYSQCLFHSHEETLEQAAENKLESIWNALELKPGMRLLDIGAGWGGVTEYCGARGVHVTSLTLADDSANYIGELIATKNLPGEVLVEDLLEHRPAEPYDCAVCCGVIEHIPNYRRFCTSVWQLLRPGGRLYLDASATKEKFAVGPFAREYIWRGHHTFLALPDLLEELLFHGFEIVRARRETRDYELTIVHWAERLDAAREDIIRRWGEPVYRAFRVYLWAGGHAFRTNRLQAYNVVAERRGDPGPRPGNARRFAHFVASLR